MIAAKDLLGIGLYSPYDAALYARVTTQLMNRWVFGNAQGKAVIQPQIDDAAEKIVTFLDFVQALAIRRIRNERRVPLGKIREAYFRARDEFDVTHPFALDSTRIGLFGPLDVPAKQEIYLCVGEDDEGARQFFQITGKKHGNQLIGEVVRTYASRLVFDEQGFASKYKAFEHKEGNVTMDPCVRFGEPFLDDSGYTARTLFDAYRSEGSVERAAEIYGVKPEEIVVAIEYFDYLRPTCLA